MSKLRAGELLYPTEQSRFLLAASASVIVFGVLGLAIATAVGVEALLLTAAALAFTGGLVCDDNVGGRVARYTTDDGRAAFLWTDESRDILTFAASDTVDLATLYDWWSNDDDGPVD